MKIITPEEAVENLVAFLKDEHNYIQDEIEMIVQGDFKGALESKYKDDKSWDAYADFLSHGEDIEIDAK